MVVDVILLKDSAPVVIEIDPHLFPTVDAVVPQDGLATCGDPHPRQSIGVDLVAFDLTTPTVMLRERKHER